MKEIIWSRVLKAVSIKRIINSWKVITSLGLSSITKNCFVWGVPFILTVEPSVLCNLRCPQCVTGMGKVNREKDCLSLNLFKNIIQQLGDRIWHLLLYNQGEPFLNQNLIEFIDIAKQEGIYVTISTNGHYLRDEEFVQKLVNSGLDTIIISLDGADPETYLKYRLGGTFHQVVNGIRNLIEIRNRCNSRTPIVLLQCLVMKHNENRLDQMKQLADRLKVDRLLFKTFQIESKDEGLHFLPENPKWRRYSINSENLYIKNFVKRGCSRLWYSTVILSDGSVVPCCFDKTGKYTFGNIVTTTSINEIWKSDAYNEFRNKVLRRRGSIRICQNCSQKQKIYL
jgi:radical SAM protein with 4Fe4S-binding SPASM domain